MKKIVFTLQILLIISLFASSRLFAQGFLSGDLYLNANFYNKDSLRGADGTPFYEYLGTGSESWLSVNYSNPDWDFSAGMRFDLFLNSNLIDPLRPYPILFTPDNDEDAVNSVSGQGIGNWYLRKTVDKLTLTGGYFYDQFGTGAIFRAYEERIIGLDKSVFGLKAEYELPYEIYLKAFMGRQKNLFGLNTPILKGANAETFKSLGEKLSILPGAAYINRTYNDSLMYQIGADISAMDQADRFQPLYNVHSWAFYNTLNAGPISWFVEYADKTDDQFLDINSGKWKNYGGQSIYTSLSYSIPKFGITAQAKRTEKFSLNTDPYAVVVNNAREGRTPNRVNFNFLAPLAQENSLRLLTLYAPAVNDTSELAYQVSADFSPKRELQFAANFSNISTLNDSLLFREIFADVTFKKKKAPWKVHTGFQYLDYNMAVFRGKSGYLNSLTPFAEFTYKFDRKKSTRAEFMYMITSRNEQLTGKEIKKVQDEGDWLFGLIEFNIAPKWSFSISDMYNVGNPDDDLKIHFPIYFVGYTTGSNRFTMSYAKQVDGIICTGGVCRFEPAFSGIKFTMSSSF